MIASPADSPLPTHKRMRRRLVAAALLYGTLLALAIWLGDALADARARDQGQQLARSAALSRASLLVSELQKYRLLPIVLGDYPLVRKALAAPQGAPVRALDAKLEGLARAIGSSAVYLLDAHGRAIAASNWQSPTSFVGQDYSFRPYFTQAKARGAAEFFGLGTVSHQPGLFLSRRVGTGAEAGVIVVKFGFDAVEAGWGAQPDIVYVADADGVVLLTNRPNWRYGATQPLAPREIAAIRRARQFDAIAPFPLPLRRTSPGIVAVGEGGGDLPYAAASTRVPVEGWTLTDLEPLAPLRSASLATARLAIAAFAVGLLLLLVFWIRARERADLAAATRLELERRVLERTEALEASQARFRAAREELAHANRLGSIGQITAAVAHEINQPVGAIRAFADNAGEFLRRGDGASGARNLAQIVRLTERIGNITAELRAYARRGSGAIRPVALDAALDGALMLIGHGLRQHEVAVAREGDTGLRVLADRVRLEQIFVNVIQNAIEATAGVPSPTITFIFMNHDDIVRIAVADNGPGVDPRVADTLFAAFATTKPDGLGLGLGIARDIAREFGGDLELADSAQGACFLLTLRPA